MSKRIIAMTALVLSLAAVILAQEGPETRFEERLEVSEVLMDVLVTDRAGNIVAGLGEEDFVVEVEGEPVELTGATFYATRYLLGEDAPEAGQVPASRYLLLFFHDQRRTQALDNRLLRRQMEAVRDAKRWVEEEMQPSDWVAVLSHDYRLKIHQDFTQDRQALLGGLDEVLRGKDPDRRPASEQLGEGRASLPSLSSYLPEGKELRRETTRIYDSIRLVAEASGHIVGRKNLILFSAGFGELDGFSPIARPDLRYYPKMERALNANNVAVYPVDTVPSEFEHPQSHFLSGLAADTGGTYSRAFVSFITPIREISREAQGYYLLSFSARHPGGESGYRRVKVETRNPSLRVRAPSGFRYGG